MENIMTEKEYRKRENEIVQEYERQKAIREQKHAKQMEILNWQYTTKRSALKKEFVKRNSIAKKGDIIRDGAGAYIVHSVFAEFDKDCEIIYSVKRPKAEKVKLIRQSNVTRATKAKRVPKDTIVSKTN
jgi:hypothetical protein